MRLRRCSDRSSATSSASSATSKTRSGSRSSSSAATHGFLPLLSRDESIQLQLDVGRASTGACSAGRRADAGCRSARTGRAGRGSRCLTPGHRSSDPASRTTSRDAGFRYFFIDSHMARAGSPLGLYGAGLRERAGARSRRRGRADGNATRTPYRAYRVTSRAHARRRSPRSCATRESSAQVWSRHRGYPGRRTLPRVPQDSLAGRTQAVACHRQHGRSRPEGAVRPADARRQSHRRTRAHFASLLDIGDVHPVHRRRRAWSAPFDTELFGHWWFEGPDFLGDRLSIVARTRRSLGRHRVGTSRRVPHAHRAPARRGLVGRERRLLHVANGQTVWTWPMIWELEDRFWTLARARDRAASRARDRSRRRRVELLLSVVRLAVHHLDR